MNQLSSRQKQNSMLWPSWVLIVSTPSVLGLIEGELETFFVALIFAGSALPFLLLGTWLAWRKLWALFFVPPAYFSAGLLYLYLFVPKDLGWGAFGLVGWLLLD